MAAKSEEEEAQRQAFLAMMEVKEQVRNRLLPKSVWRCSGVDETLRAASSFDHVRHSAAALLEPVLRSIPKQGSCFNADHRIVYMYHRVNICFNKQHTHKEVYCTVNSTVEVACVCGGLQLVSWRCLASHDCLTPPVLFRRNEQHSRRQWQSGGSKKRLVMLQQK